MCRRGVACSAGPNRGRPSRAGATTVRGPPCLHAEALLPPPPSRPEPRRFSGHLRHTVPPGPPWRSAPIYQIHGSAPRTRTRTHNNHAICQRVVSPSDRQMGDTEPNQDQERDGNGTYRPLVMRQHICC